MAQTEPDATPMHSPDVLRIARRNLFQGNPWLNPADLQTWQGLADAHAATREAIRTPPVTQAEVVDFPTPVIEQRPTAKADDKPTEIPPELIVGAVVLVGGVVVVGTVAAGIAVYYATRKRT